MANSFTLLADIKAGRCSIIAEVRLLRFWESPNVKRGSKLMGVDMLLIDKQSTLMEGSVSVNLLSIFIERFSEGSVYTMCEFEVTQSNNSFRKREVGYIPRRSNKHGVQLNRVVTIVLMVLYTWRESSSIKGISDGDNKTDVELPDGVSGEVRESTNANHQPSSSVVPGGGRLASTKPVDGLNENGEKALMFHNKLDGFGGDPRVVVGTNINPKIVEGEEPPGATLVMSQEKVQDTMQSMLLREAKPVNKVSNQGKCLTPPRETGIDVCVLDVESKNESYLLTEVPRKEPDHKPSHEPPHKWNSSVEQCVHMPRLKMKFITTKVKRCKEGSKPEQVVQRRKSFFNLWKLSKFYNQFQTISTNRSHLWLIRFEPPTTIWATQHSSLQQISSSGLATNKSRVSAAVKGRLQVKRNKLGQTRVLKYDHSAK
ncbi:hypothetical protein Bca52824_086353 [Brassica carinata]|uniref:Uncharacterized protein n=1 Tax=Brassica carinata TaxID=52824 RepID=A0A8X7P8U8_BRACI|nr:hypothetical protein Bca52824_086353 [Brassica carinata]